MKYGKVRPIVLVGGQNGAGKTTILDALRLCLYGRLALGARVREQDYMKYLRERIHRNPGVVLNATWSSVAVEFEYARGGERVRYNVERAWECTTSKVEEKLTVLCDGQPLGDVDSEYWSDFLRSLIPPGLSQLFFFDGEKIQKLAEDDSDSAALADAVKSLLGLDLVERLQADLDVYLSRAARRSASGERATKIAALAAEDAQLRQQVTDLTQDEAAPRTAVEYAQKEIGLLEQRLAGQGQGLASQRAILKERQKELEASEETLGRSLRELCETAVPFAACRKIAQLLEQQLQQEEDLDRWATGRSQVEGALKHAAAHLTKGEAAARLRLSAEHRRMIRSELDKLNSSLTAPPPELRNVQPLHGLSPTERASVRGALNDSERQAKALQELAKQFARQEVDLVRTRTTLNKVPANSISCLNCVGKRSTGTSPSRSIGRSAPRSRLGSPPLRENSRSVSRSKLPK
jgi:DNA sulfur modification protein DndD